LLLQINAVVHFIVTIRWSPCTNGLVLSPRMQCSRLDLRTEGHINILCHAPFSAPCTA